MDLHQILTKSYERYNRHDIIFADIEKATKERIYKDFLEGKTVKMYPDDCKTGTTYWDHNFEEAKWRTRTTK